MKSTLITIQKVDGALALYVLLNVTVRAVMCVSEAVAFSMHSHELLSAYLFRPSVCLSESLRLSLPCTRFCLLPCLLVCATSGTDDVSYEPSCSQQHQQQQKMKKK